jgi:ERCC4-type nuclease
VIFLVSPSEPQLIKAMGRVSSVPETRGADVMWFSATSGLCGIQRKTTEDLIGSIHNGRLNEELAKMVNLALAVLVVEGRPRWTTDGQLLHRYIRFTRAAYRSILRSVQLRGILVDHSDDTADTVVLIESIAKWSEKGEHRSLDRRPKPQSTPEHWGKITNRTWASHLLQSVPGIGPVQANAIFDHFGSRLPVGLTVTEKELLEVKGLGPGRVRKIVAAFGGKAGEDT